MILVYSYQSVIKDACECFSTDLMAVLKDHRDQLHTNTLISSSLLEIKVAEGLLLYNGPLPPASFYGK